jgi:UDP-N-acetylglucosamine 2-epimerase (non-hydrolysing)
VVTRESPELWTDDVPAYLRLMKNTLLHVVGARPNFPKLAPVYRAAEGRASQRIVHTGQHYDDLMSDAFIRELGLPAPDHALGVGSGSHAQQTARLFERLEGVLLDSRPDWVVVYGDVNSTLAAAIVATKLGIRVAHVEAGLRSGDRSMPEEINRILTDRIADLLLTPSRAASEVLRREGEPEDEITFVGNVMVDSLLSSVPKAERSGARKRLGLSNRFVVATLHRPSNVDTHGQLSRVMQTLDEVASDLPVLLFAHPRTTSALKKFQIKPSRVRVHEPIPYIEMLELMNHAHAVVTDSGGIQEETTVLGVPCFTLRRNTERPITITEGTNTLVPEPEALPELVRAAQRQANPRRPEGWDGHAGERVVEAILARS